MKKVFGEDPFFTLIHKIEQKAFRSPFRNLTHNDYLRFRLDSKFHCLLQKLWAMLPYMSDSFRGFI